MVKRCSDKKHKWKLYRAKHNHSAEGAKDCTICGLMQVEASIPNLYWNATIEEFDQRIEELKKIDKLAKEAQEEEKLHDKKIEEDRIKNLERRLKQSVSS